MTQYGFHPKKNYEILVTNELYSRKCKVFISIQLVRDDYSQTVVKARIVYGSPPRVKIEEIFFIYSMIKSYTILIFL